jgi:hypothetical protein
METPETLYISGQSLFNGTQGVEKNQQEAIVKFQLAADQGHVGAQFSLAECFDYGFGGCVVDKVEAAKYYGLAAQQGHKVAQNNLANYYLHGIGVGKNEEEAFKLFTQAADEGRGSASAIQNLALCYKNGTGVSENTAEADRLNKLALAKASSVRF